MRCRLPVLNWGRSDFNFDQVPFGVEHGHTETFNPADFRVCGKARNLGVRPDSFHRPDASVVGNQMTRKCNEVGELCERARHDYIEKTWDFCTGLQIFHTSCDNREIRQSELHFAWDWKAVFL